MSMSDQEMKKDIIELNLTAARVTPEQIDELMNEVTYHVYQPKGSTSTSVTAFYGMKFSLCTEIMALGEKCGMEKCKNSARDMLWKLEIASLKKSMTVSTDD